jgi:hypothetical protein
MPAAHSAQHHLPVQWPARTALVGVLPGPDPLGGGACGQHVRAARRACPLVEALAEVYPRRGHLATFGRRAGLEISPRIRRCAGVCERVATRWPPRPGFLLRGELMQGYLAEVDADSGRDGPRWTAAAGALPRRVVLAVLWHRFSDVGVCANHSTSGHLRGKGVKRPTSDSPVPPRPWQDPAGPGQCRGGRGQGGSRGCAGRAQVEYGRRPDRPGRAGRRRGR